MLVCGLTFDHSTNYGSCFQAYALQTAIEQLSISGECCHYDLIPLSQFLQKTSQPAKGGSWKSAIINMVLRRINRSRRQRFAKFENQYMHYAECHSVSDLPLLNDKYDAFVCGSDVIWNFKFTHGNPAYFLDFASKYKFSYAASFGKADIHAENGKVQSGEEAEDIYKRYISKLNGVSVREKDAVSIASRFTDQIVEQVLDPVLLMTANEWELLTSKKKTKTQGYIFAYNTYSRDYFDEFLQKLKQQTGLPVVHITWNVADAVRQKKLYYPAPEKWLTLLRNADYVVTNSFHATAFSTIFHKRFFTVLRYGKLAGANIRMYDFLHDVGLDDRIITETPDFIQLNIPDFSIADSVIQDERMKSIAYLKRNLIQAL